ncbi:MAG: CRTAC1 family protein, partial [Planctomycetota bacterium]|nr:CRTAC1 family protein [Planctomycetota bacterium]
VRVYCHPRIFNGQGDLLYRGKGDGSFEDVSRKAGISRAGPADGKGLGVVAADFDGDGLQDLYVTNDTTSNFLWRNRGDGTFVDVAYDWGVALSSAGKAQAGMGVDCADVKGDGQLDIHVTNFSSETNNLFMSDGPGSYQEGIQGARLGGSYERLGFGTLFGDFDLDGDSDLAIVNGHVDDLVEVSSRESGIRYRQPPELLLNRGDGSFLPAPAPGPVFSREYVGRGLASADYDNDGDLDLLICTIDQGAVLLRNNRIEQKAPGSNFLSIRLIGRTGPRDAYGSRVLVEAGGKSRLFSCQAGRSYLSSVDPRIHVGLGESAAAEKISITWVGGQTQVLRDVPANQHLELEEPVQ